MIRLRTRTAFHDGRRGSLPRGRLESLLEFSGLDELPQVLNVLRGEMTIVGPRPLTDREIGGSPIRRRMLGVPPGMTGRWQVSWRYAPTQSDARAMDADYFRRWRLSDDIDVIVRTPVVIVLRGCSLGDTELQRRRELADVAA